MQWRNGKKTHKLQIHFGFTHEDQPNMNRVRLFYAPYKSRWSAWKLEMNDGIEIEFMMDGDNKNKEKTYLETKIIGNIKS